MPIVIDRCTSKVINKPEITLVQRDALWEAYINRWLDRHPEIFNQEQSAELKEDD